MSSFFLRLTQLLADHAPPPTSGSPLSHREAQLKLKALNQATVKLASQLEQREAENQRLKQQLEKVLVHCTLYAGFLARILNLGGTCRSSCWVEVWHWNIHVPHYG